LIASLRGKIISRTPDGIVIEVRGVGYHVHIPLSHLADLPEHGEEVFLYIHTLVRDDTIGLYGFLREEEKRIFTTLMGIAGIGPKMALAILSGISVERFIEAVHNEDIGVLSAIPGLGKKTAARIVLELKGRLPAIVSEERGSLNLDDAISALLSLGYKRKEAEGAVKKAREQGAGEIEEVIKRALSILTGQD